VDSNGNPLSSFEERLRESLSPAYDIERELTGAGMSRVFVATDRALGRMVVIKVLPPELTAGVNRERFRREIQVAAQLQHPHIVTLLAAGEDGDILYYTMPFIEGESLRTALEKGPLSVRDVVRILHDVVDALAYAHARGVIHRDIKPGNILRQGSHALVTDFGVAKALNAALPVSGITSAGMAIGTPAYMAPEQLAGDPAADNRIDIYAVGLLAYELLTGESPFTGPSPQATMAAQLTRNPEPLYIVCPDVPPPLSAIIMQCLEKEPAKRPPSAEALMTALDSITTSSGDVKLPATQTLAAVTQRRRRMVAAAGVASVLLGSAVAVFASQKRNESSPATVASDVAATATPSTSGSASAATPQVAAPVPVVLTREDSMAIARAVRQRLAEEEAVRGVQSAKLYADSIAKYARKVAIDSIIKATLPRGMTVPVWSESAPVLPELPVMSASESRRVVVVGPRSSREELNAFGRSLTDNIRKSLSGRRDYDIVDADSVDAASAQVRGRGDLERALKPDVVISPQFVGNGDTMTVLVTVRDTRNPQLGVRIASGKFRVDDPDASIPALVALVGAQLENLNRTRVHRMNAPAPPARGKLTR
jgi:serine/threonine protein kinase